MVKDIEKWIKKRWKDKIGLKIEKTHLVISVTLVC
jgi:hypothetical protein